MYVHAHEGIYLSCVSVCLSVTTVVSTSFILMLSTLVLSFLQCIAPDAGEDRSESESG